MQIEPELGQVRGDNGKKSKGVFGIWLFINFIYVMQ